MDERMERFFRSRRARPWPRRAGRALWFLEYEGAAVAAFSARVRAAASASTTRASIPRGRCSPPASCCWRTSSSDAIDRGFPVFDFLRGEEPYKYGFGPSPEDVLNVTGDADVNLSRRDALACTPAPSPRWAARRPAG